VRSVGEFRLKGFQRPVAAFDVLGIREPANPPPVEVS
jgi:class 3 adenylate cyclase